MYSCFSSSLYLLLEPISTDLRLFSNAKTLNMPKYFICNVVCQILVYFFGGGLNFCGVKYYILLK